MLPSPSLGPRWLWASWSPPLPCGMGFAGWAGAVVGGWAGAVAGGWAGRGAGGAGGVPTAACARLGWWGGGGGWGCAAGPPRPAEPEIPHRWGGQTAADPP